MFIGFAMMIGLCYAVGPEVAGFMLVLIVADLFFAGDFFISESKKQMSEICSSIKEEFPQFEKSDLNDFDDYL